MARYIQSSPPTAIESVQVRFQEPSVTKFLAVSVVVGDTEHHYQLEYGYPAGGTDERLDLFALKNIRESAAGIVNAAGDAVIPFVTSFLHGTTIEDLVAFGYPDPLKGNGPFNDYIKGQQYLGQTAMDATVEADAATGKVSATARFDIIPKRRKPPASFNHPLDDWYASELSTYEWEFIFVFDAGTVHDDYFHFENPPLLAFRTKMFEIKTSGADVDQPEDSPVLQATYDGRTFTTRFNTQTHDMAFTITDVIRDTYTENGVQYIRSARVQCLQDGIPPPSVYAKRINQWLQDTENVYGILDGGDTAVEPTYIGDPRWPSLANGIRSASGALRILEGGIEFDKGGADRFTLGPGHGLVVDVADLKSDSQYRLFLPVKTEGADVVHCHNINDVKIVLQKPSDIILWDNNHYTCEIHKIAGAGAVKLLKPDYTEIFVLALGESITIRMVRETSGKWEIRFLDVPKRTFKMFSAETAAPWSNFGTGSDGANWFYADNLRYYITPDLNSVQTNELDAVSFEYAGTFVASNGPHSTLDTDYTPNTVKMLTAGSLQVDHYAAYKAAGSGSVNPGWGAVMQLNDALDNYSRINKHRFTAEGNDSLRIGRVIDVAIDDLITFRTVFGATSSLSPGNFEMSEKSIQLVLTPTLETITP